MWCWATKHGKYLVGWRMWIVFPFMWEPLAAIHEGYTQIQTAQHWVNIRNVHTVQHEPITQWNQWQILSRKRILPTFSVGGCIFHVRTQCSSGCRMCTEEGFGFVLACSASGQTHLWTRHDISETISHDGEFANTLWWTGFRGGAMVVVISVSMFDGSFARLWLFGLAVSFPTHFFATNKHTENMPNARHRSRVFFRIHKNRGSTRTEIRVRTCTNEYINI